MISSDPWVASEAGQVTLNQCPLRRTVNVGSESNWAVQSRFVGAKAEFGSIGLNSFAGRHNLGNSIPDLD
ncbi:hypothetical protein SB772_25895 [Paraburkholderia sp. SIMBA_030]